MRIGRRQFVAAGLTAGAGIVVGCGVTDDRARDLTAHRVDYGRDDQQYALLRRPRGSLRGTVVLLHGGYWQAGFGAELMEPMARAFNARGYATWNVEYRRVGSGGGFPTTLEDVAAAMDRLEQEDLPDPVVVGHSAGGHLAVWAASRTARTPGGSPRGRLRGAISLSGLLDLTEAARSPRSLGPTVGFMAGAPGVVPQHYALADPTLLVPASCPVWACQATADAVVPADQARRYVAAAKAAGAEASYVALPGGHLALIDPRAAAFPTTLSLVARAARRS